jgi:CRP/FNR family transcriptional regulator, cyclic AMP receptor protein
LRKAKIRRGDARRRPAFITKPYCFFAHVAFALEARAHASPQATANLIVEINDRALASAADKKQVKVPALTDPQKTELVGEIAMAAALDYLKSEKEFRQFPTQRFVNFDLIRPSYISIRPPPTKVLQNGAKVWRLAQTEADELRGEARSVRYPDIERRLAAHPFLKGMSPHHLELLALCAMPTEFDAGQTIFLEGDPANGFYLIETGTVTLEGRTSTGKSVVIDTVSAGEPLGWSWLFPPYLWHFDARAAQACSAICLSGIMLRQHRDEDPTLSHEIFKRTTEVVVRRLQAARNTLISRK